MINIYRIEWSQSGNPIESPERVAFVLAGNVEQIAKAYPTLKVVKWVGKVEQDLSEPKT